MGSFSIISQTHAKLSHQRLQHIEFVARIRIGSPFRCAVTDSQLLRLMESLSCSQNRTSAHRKGGPSTSLHHTKDACLQGGTQGKSKNCYRPRINYNLLISIQSSSPVNHFHGSSDHRFCQDCRGGAQGNSKNCYRPRINQNLLISIQSPSPVSQLHEIRAVAFVKILSVKQHGSSHSRFQNKFHFKIN